MIHQSLFPNLPIPDADLCDILLTAMAARPDDVAMIDAATDLRLTNREVIDAVRRVASGLSRRGFGKGAVFAILSPNVLEYPIAILAAARLGGIATTMNPLNTEDEIAHQLAEAKARFVLTVPALAAKSTAAARRAGVEEVFVVGSAPPTGTTAFSALYDPNPIDTFVSIDPATDIVALPWSSGTSGHPKAVMLTHRNLIAQIQQFATVQQIGEGGSMIAVLPFFHIYGLVLILLASLWRNIPLVIMARFELEPFLAALQKYQISMAPVVPPIIVALAKHPAVAKYDLSALKYMMSGAAPLGADLEAACAERLDCLVIQGYGMTELTGASHLHPFEVSKVRRGSVGLLVPGMEAQIVVPETGQRVGLNERGELWLRGPNVMPGYWNQPESTAKTLDPEGWLRTGDIGYVDGDGYYYIVDRLKELIKYKGHQVAPADLEAVLLTHPDIADAAVIPSPDEEAGEVPKAFVVLRGVLSADEIISYVAERVGPMERVRRVAIVESIPKSPSGKILRRVLVEQERASLAG